MEILQGMEILQDMGIILYMEAKHNKLLHSTTISRRKYIYRQLYNIYAYVLH